MSTNVSTERTASEKRFPKMKRGLAGMIYLSYICTRNSAKGELSSVGSERLPYKQRVGGSNPSAPTTENQPLTVMQVAFLFREHSSVGLERLLDKQEVSGSNPLVPTSRKAFRIRFGRLFCRHCGNAAQEKDGYAGIRLLFIMKQGRAICRSLVRGCCRGRLSPERRREAQRPFRTCRCTP